MGEIRENELVCRCKKVTLADIENALDSSAQLSDALKIFDHVRDVTKCSTCCGGCHDKILGIISEHISG